MEKVSFNIDVIGSLLQVLVPVVLKNANPAEAQTIEEVLAAFFNTEAKDDGQA